MINEIIFIFHVVTIAVFSLIALRLGQCALVTFIVLQSILSNLFVTKQILLFGMNVTCCDAFAVGSFLGLNLLQEYHGNQIAKKTVTICFFCMLLYIILGQINLLYIPNQFDTMHAHFFEIFHLMPRITIASIASYSVVQIFDVTFFKFLKTILNNSYPTTRTIICIAVSQILDTILFSFLALYGVIHSISSIIFISFVIKIMIVTLFSPFIKLAKWICKQQH